MPIAKKTGESLTNIANTDCIGVRALHEAAYSQIRAGFVAFLCIICDHKNLIMSLCYFSLHISILNFR